MFCVFLPSVTGQARETEATKLIAVRAGLLDMSQAWESLGRRCTMLSETQKVCSNTNPKLTSISTRWLCGTTCVVFVECVYNYVVDY